MSTKKRKKKVLTIVLSLILFIGAGFLLISSLEEIMSTAQLKEELRESEQLLASIKKENIELSDQKEKLEDPEYVKSYARGTYMLSKEGEQIFYLPSSDDQ